MNRQYYKSHIVGLQLGLGENMKIVINAIKGTQNAFLLTQSAVTLP